MDYYKIGQCIRKARKANGLSQEELAERVDISTTHMSQIETGNTKLSLPVLVAIAQALQIQTDTLLNDGTASADAAMAEIVTVLDGCNPKEARVIADVVKTAKRSMDVYL